MTMMNADITKMNYWDDDINDKVLSFYHEDFQNDDLDEDEDKDKLTISYFRCPWQTTRGVASAAFYTNYSRWLQHFINHSFIYKRI